MYGTLFLGPYFQVEKCVPIVSRGTVSGGIIRDAVFIYTILTIHITTEGAMYVFGLLLLYFRAILLNT